MPSGGALMMRSSRVTPEASSILRPRSRAIFTVLNKTRSSGPTVATRRPFWSKTSALAGMFKRHAVALQAQAHIGEGARHQFTSGVVEGELHLRGAGIDIDRLRGSLDHRIEGTILVFRHGDHGLGAILIAGT